jgi:hypothetical protein
VLFRSINAGTYIPLVTTDIIGSLRPSTSYIDLSGSSENILAADGFSAAGIILSMSDIGPTADNLTLSETIALTIGVDYQDYTDTFANLSHWTADVGTWSLHSGTYRAGDTGGVHNAAHFDGMTAGIDQYAKVQLVSNDFAYPSIIFRRTGIAGDKYYKLNIRFGYTNVAWQWGTDDNDAQPDGDIVTANFGSIVAQGDYIGVSVTGTGANTIVKAWRWDNNPGAYNTWGAAEITFTTPTFSNPPYACDTGKTLGLHSYNETYVVDFDNWACGDAR